MNGELTLTEIHDGLMVAIAEGKKQYTTGVWRDIFDDIEAHLENSGCEYGVWCHLEEWFTNFAIAEELGDPNLENLDVPGSDKLSLCFTWEL